MREVRRCGEKKLRNSRWTGGRRLARCGSSTMSVSLFMPAHEGSSIRRVLDDHDDELTKLLAPLVALREVERRAINAFDIAHETAAAWEVNDATLRALLPLEPPLVVAVASTDSQQAPQTRSEDAARKDVPAISYSSAAMVIAHLVRDWSAIGTRTRARTHRPVLRALRARQQTLRRPLSVLVPGAGACRLAWEIARLGLGNRVEANDASAAMLVAARSVLVSVAPQQLTLHPNVRCASGVVRRSACLVAQTIPDVLPRLDLPRTGASIGRGWRSRYRSATAGTAVAPALTLQVGSWAAPQTPPPPHGAAPGANATFDAVVTSYFLDTQADPAAAIALVRSRLGPDGVWVNVGPLHWHEPSAGLLRLTLDEVKRFVRAVLPNYSRHAARTCSRLPLIALDCF